MENYWTSICANQRAGQDNQNVGSLSAMACTTDGGSDRGTYLKAWAIASTSSALRDHFGVTTCRWNTPSQIIITRYNINQQNNTNMWLCTFIA